MRNQKIIVFDSGLGGLTVWQHIRALAPDLECHYVFDNALFPYGELEQDVLNHRVSTILASQLTAIKPDAIVIACNTASTSVLAQLRHRIKVPIIGVVPAIKPAAASSNSKHMALLATPATVNRDYTDQLVADFAADCQVTKLGIGDLVQMAEHYLLNGEIDIKRLAQLLEPIRSQSTIDTLVLGCTHYPLLASPISEILPGIRLVDSGYAVARQVIRQLARELDEVMYEPVDGFYYSTAAVADPDLLQQAMKGFGLKQGRLINLP
ncbi:glutamate racemase [Neiella marina]|uniref:Glutamate racemase n=1 Tax=Neiella marina TaxID=508461 RepID=A0A8J2U9L8_9GAMM|nr:glutamate racemase [Neiella marina]GGA88805.1 glutamate racemase [Neiella marina]